MGKINTEPEYYFSIEKINDWRILRGYNSAILAVLMVAQNENAAPDNWKVMGDTLVTLLQKTIWRDK